MRRVVPFIVLIALAACRQEPEAATPVVAETAAVPGATSPSPTASAKPSRDMREVTLSADGIILVGAAEGRGTATTLSFGERAAVLDVMEVDFGKPKLSRNAECGAGPMEFAAWGPLTLNFLDGRFAGWRAEQGAQVVTVDGVQLGNTLADIKRERSARRIPDTTLDGEFEYTSGDGGTIGGFLEGPGDTGKVVSLHAGTNCFFR